MGEYSSHSSNAALKRVALKDLGPDLDNVLIVGIIIAKQRPRKFADNKSKDSEDCRAVWNFTLRDSQRDYINVTYWGNSETICAANDKFYTGDVVEVRNPRISIRKFNDVGEQFRPMVTSPYSLNLNEHSEIFAYDGDNFFFTKLLNLPTKPIAGFVPLRDIHNEGGNMKERFVDILGAIRSIGTVRNVSTKNGQETQLREVVLFDHTSPGLKITIWETDVITRASSWKTRSTILFITDARVEWSNFLRAYSATLTNRSIVTENPIGEEAISLANYAKSAPLETSAILDQLITALPDPDSIQNVMCVQQVCNKVNTFLQETAAADRPLTALMFVFITNLDLDGQSPTTSIK
ncbi:meiosis-specific with OB domain-containing protein, partial [Asbolus verrucosus]